MASKEREIIYMKDLNKSSEIVKRQDELCNEIDKIVIEIEETE